MIERSHVRELLMDLFQEEALMLGGLIAIYHPEDEFIWRLFRNLDAIRRKAFRRMEGESQERGASVERDNPATHPALSAFLDGIGRE